MANLSLRNINKVYENGYQVVKNFNLEVEDKEFVALVGPSGCGKSAILSMIAGIEDITSGEIYIGNKLVNGVAAKKRDVAMIFQNYALYPRMTVYENIALGLKLRKIPEDEIDRRVKEAADILKLQHLLEHKPKNLSEGQRYRVAMARAVVCKPKVLLMDNLLLNLDEKLKKQMINVIIKIHKKYGITMVYATNEEKEAKTLGARIIQMGT